MSRCEELNQLKLTFYCYWVSIRWRLLDKKLDDDHWFWFIGLEIIIRCDHRSVGDPSYSKFFFQ